MIRRLSSNDELGLSTVVHKTWYDNDFFDGRVPVVVTVHDLIPELFGKSNRSTVTKKIVCEKATKIIVISETTKTDLLNLYKVPEDRVHVIYHGVDLDRSVGETVPRSADQPLLLFVGARGWYKNFNRLVEAIASSSLLKQNCTVQCCGGGPFTNRELDRIRSLGLVGSFKHCSPSDRELQEFYRRAQILVVPSLYEGFGLPVLEAMAHGCTVACSNQGALPEVAGDAAAFFDPTEPDSIAAAIGKVCFDRTFHAELQRRGFTRCKLFRWDACAAATRLVYQESLKA
jgi:glycosyltransferase involved in cell wall biosynthesis